MALPDNALAHLCVPARATSLRLLRAVVSRAAELAGADPELTERLVLAVNEAGMNIVQHAYGDEAGGDLELEVLTEGDDLVFVLIDHAPPVDPGCLQGRRLDELRPGGLGVHFIQEIMDSFRIAHLDGQRGNRLELRKKIR